jgi:hypothetical protein
VQSVAHALDFEFNYRKIHHSVIPSA